MSKIPSALKDYFRTWSGRMFPVWYLLLGALSFNSFTAGRPYMSVFIALILALAAVRGCFMAAGFKKARPIALLPCFAAFILSYALSTIASRAYGISENLQALVWLFLCLFIVYPAGFYELRTEGSHAGPPVSRVFTAVLLFYSAFQAAAGFILLITGHNSLRPVNIYLGFWYGRLWGAYTDPNYGAVLSAVSIIVSLMCLTGGRISKKLRWIFIAHIIFQYAYIVFSYSRGAMIIFAFMLLLFYLYWCISVRRGAAKSIGMAVLLISLVLSAYPIKNGYNAIVDIINQVSEENGGGEVAEELDREEASIESEFTLSDGRVAIWENGFDIMKKNPVFGVSFRNMLPYMQDKMPDCYMATHDEPLAACHNMVADIAASQGVTGVIILAATVALAAVKSVKGWKYLSRREKDEAMLFGLAAATTVGGAMFISDVFYINSPTTVVFWFCFGQWMARVSIRRACDPALDKQIDDKAADCGKQIEQ